MCMSGAVGGWGAGSGSRTGWGPLCRGIPHTTPSREPRIVEIPWFRLNCQNCQQLQQELTAEQRGTKNHHHRGPNNRRKSLQSMV